MIFEINTDLVFRKLKSFSVIVNIGELKMKSKINYDEKCPICAGFIGKYRDEANIIYETEMMVVALNPRGSPHFLRTAIIPKRHLGDAGKYGVDNLMDCEYNEYKKLKMTATDAIIKTSSDLGIKLKKREGQPLVDYLVRPSVHPSGDLFPSYEGEVEFMGYVFPEYIETRIRTHNMPRIAESSPTILASFPKTNEDLTMPVKLRKNIVADLQKNFDCESIRVA